MPKKGKSSHEDERDMDGEDGPNGNQNDDSNGHSFEIIDDNDQFGADAAPLEEPKKESGKKGKLKGMFGKKKSKDEGFNSEPKEKSDSPKKRFSFGKKKNKDEDVVSPQPTFEQTEDFAPPSDTMAPPGNVYVDEPMVKYPPPPSEATTPSDHFKMQVPRSDRLRGSMRGVLQSKPPAALVPQGPGLAEMKPLPPKSRCGSGTVLTLTLIAGILLGILLTALGTIDKALFIIGPSLLALSVLALLAKVFFVVIHQQDPFPKLRPYVEKAEQKFTLNKTLQKNQSKPGPAFENAALSRSHEAIEMETQAYHQPNAYGYDTEINTNLRVQAGKPNSYAYSDEKPQAMSRYSTSQEPPSGRDNYDNTDQKATDYDMEMIGGEHRPMNRSLDENMETVGDAEDVQLPSKLNDSKAQPKKKCVIM